MLTTALTQATAETRMREAAPARGAREERAAAPADSVVLGAKRASTEGLIQNQGVIKSSRIFYGDAPENDARAGYPAEREVGREVEFQSGLVLRQDNATYSVSVLQRNEDGMQPIAVLDNTYMLMPMENPQPNLFTSYFTGRRPDEESTVLLQGTEVGEMIDANGTITVIDRKHATPAGSEVVNMLSAMSSIFAGPFTLPSPFGLAGGMLAVRPMAYDRYTIRPENAAGGAVEGVQYRRSFEPYVPMRPTEQAVKTEAKTYGSEKGDGKLQVAISAFPYGMFAGTTFPLGVAVTRPRDVEGKFENGRIAATRAMDFGEPQAVSIQPLVAPSLFQLPSQK